MMKRAMVLLVPAVLLSGCGKGVEMKNASVSEVAEEVKAAAADGQFVSPGHWESTMTIKEMNMPGMPPEAVAQMKTVMGKAKTFASCLTEAEAKKPKEDFFSGGDGQCRYDHFTMSGGKIDAAMKCGVDGAERTMTMQGTYSPDHYHMTMAATGSGPGPAGGMSMKMEMDSKRTGACTGKENG